VEATRYLHVSEKSYYHITQGLCGCVVKKISTIKTYCCAVACVQPSVFSRKTGDGCTDNLNQCCSHQLYIE